MLIIIVCFDVDELLINSRTSGDEIDWNGDAKLWTDLLKELNAFASNLTKELGFQIKIIPCIITARGLAESTYIIEKIILAFKDYLPLVSDTHYYVHSVDQLLKIPFGKDPVEVKEEPDYVPVYLTRRYIDEKSMNEADILNKLVNKYGINSTLLLEEDCSVQNTRKRFYQQVTFSYGAENKEHLPKVHLQKVACLNRLRNLFNIKKPAQIYMIDNSNNVLANVARYGYSTISAKALDEELVVIDSPQAKQKRALIATKLKTEIFDKISKDMEKFARSYKDNGTVSLSASDHRDRPSIVKKFYSLFREYHAAPTRLAIESKLMFLRKVPIDSPKLFQIMLLKQNGDEECPPITLQCEYQNLDNLSSLQFKNERYFICRYYRDCANPKFKLGICVFNKNGNLCADYPCQITWFHLLQQNETHGCLFQRKWPEWI